MGLDILDQTLADLIYHRVLPQADGGDKAVVGDNGHWDGGINHRFFLILALGYRHVHDDQRLVILRLDTGAFLLVQRRAHKVLLQSQNIH